MNKSAIIAAALNFALFAGYALAQEDQALGTDFAVTKENVPQKEPVYSPYVGQSDPDRIPAKQQDRAYTSPIWYTP